jgi:hypothetical protein
MHDFQRQYPFFVAFLAFSLCLVSLPLSVCSQNLQSASPPPLSSNTSDGTSQKNEIEDLFAGFNGCVWYRTPNDSSRDVYLDLKDRTLILYKYLKDQNYCFITSSICYAQDEVWRMTVTGYDTTMTDQRGNIYRIVINRNGDRITIHGTYNTGIGEYIIGTFVKLFCSDHT